ncbi:hypothetical protein SeLEV6574_g07936 [Synchytrium endobioticum]|uniref:S1 motif domain-containing protein n=1 Tax=Synchytrium endobioticum TaxID=286115 RepID=A0A507CDN9_9FUNG|nr:hypothetical protein SeLEV6574_g07936 [Synchytrium endobioticum]
MCSCSPRKLMFRTAQMVARPSHRQRRSRRVGSTSKNLFLSDLKVGQKLRGLVKAIQPYGIFISIGGEGIKISGLCHVTQVSDTPVKDISTLYSVGDTVKTVILSVDELKKHIKLGLKASYFDVDDISQVDEDEKVNAGGC